MQANANRTFEHLGVTSRARVLPGSWEEVLPTLKDHQFDVIFSDTWATNSANDWARYATKEQWDFKWTDVDIATYRVLKPGGAHVWYSYLNESSQGMAAYPVTWHTSMYTELALEEMGGLRPYNATTYVDAGFSDTFLPCGIK